MAVNLDKQNLNINKAIARDSQVEWLEQDILVPDTKPDVMKIIEATGIPMIASIEVLDGSIRVGGEIVYYILYRSTENNETKGITMTYPFFQSLTVKEAKKGMHARVEAFIRNIIFSSPNERKISLKSEIIFKYVLNEVSNIQLISNVDVEDNIEYQKKEDLIYNVVNVKNEIIDAEEDMVLPDSEPNIKEILRVNSQIINPEYRVSYNKILTKGDIRLQLLYTSTMGDTNIYSFDVPFSGMIEFENINEESRFDIKYNLKNLEITKNEEGKMLNVSAEILADAIMYEEKEIAYINDFYSTTKDLKYSTEEVAVIKSKEDIEKNINIKETLGQIEGNNKVVAASVEKEYITNKISGGNAYLSGNLKVNVLIENTDTGTLENKTYELPIDETIALGKEVDEKYVDVSINVNKESVTIYSGNIDANIGLNVIITISNIDKVVLVGDIEELPIDENNFTSMYMYIVKKGDTLWNVAKKYKTSVSKIANINNITDENKLSIGQKILIIR